MTASSGPSLSAERPFPGLRPFCFADHEFFFGREDQIYALYRLLDVSRFIAVVGSSGSGKSSLLYAGLRPLLGKESREAGGRTWRWAELRPGDAPLSSLADALGKLSPDGGDAAGEAVSEARRERIAHALRRSSFGVAEALGETAGLEGQTILLVVDQFEELFRYAGTSAGARRNPAGDARWREEVTHFVQLLIEAGRDRSHDVHVLLAMRSDFIGDCARFHGLPEAVSAAQYLVPSLTRDQREEVIRKPVEKAGAAIAPALVERLLNDSGDELDQLPVLQHCLMRLWDRAGTPQAETVAEAPSAKGSEPGAAPNRHLTLDHYRAVGGIAAALSNHADEIVAGLPGLEPAIEQTFRALAETDDDGRITRRALRFRQLLAETGVPEDELRRVLDRFRADDCSFLVPALSAVAMLQPDTRIDVGHEALLRRWERISAEPGQTLETGAQQGGWLWAEEQDRQLYRALLALTAETGEASGRVTLPLDQVERRWKWWTSRPRTEAWAERYGGGFARIQQLLDDSRTALEEARQAQRREAEREAERKELEQRAAQQRRFKLAALVFATLSVFAVAAAVVAVVQWLEAEHQTSEAQRQRFLAQTRSTQAEQAAMRERVAGEKAKKTADAALDAIFKLVNRLQKSVESHGISPKIARDILEVAESSLDELEDLAEANRDNQVSMSRINIVITISDIYIQLDDTEQALEHANKARKLAEEVVQKDANSAAGQHWQSEAHSQIGQVLDRQGDLEGALANMRTARDIASRLAASRPQESEWQSALASQHTRYADMLKKGNKLDEALEENKAALRIYEQLASGDPENSAWPRAIASGYARIGELLAQERKWDEALEKFRTSLQMRQQLAQASPDDPALQSDLAASHYRIGHLWAEQSDWSRALDEYEQAGEIRARVAAAHPNNLAHQSSLADNRSYVGDMLDRLQEPDGALQAYRDALAIAAPLAKYFPQDPKLQNSLIHYHARIAGVLHRQRNLSGAVQEYRAILEIEETFAKILANSGDSKKLIDWQARQVESHGKIGDVLAEDLDLDGALKAYRDALALAEQLAKKDPANRDWHDKIAEFRRHIESLCGQTPAPATCSV